MLLRVSFQKVQKIWFLISSKEIIFLLNFCKFWINSSIGFSIFGLSIIKLIEFFIIKFPKKSSRFCLKYFSDFSLVKRMNNHKRMVVEFYFLLHYLMIVQGTLIDADVCAKREVVRNSIRATFTQMQQSNYEVLLEVSSNKFLVNMSTDWTGIQSFEIVAVKWFMELSQKIINLVKRVVLHLWEMCD